MLVLTRRIGEVTTLSGGITVTVLNIRGNQVQLGWSAPEAIKIYRDNIGDRTQSDSDTPRPHGCHPRTLAAPPKRSTSARRKFAAG